MSSVRLYLFVTFLGLGFATENYIIGGDVVEEDGKWPWQVGS